MDNQELENIRKNANIVEIISSYVPLTQKGKNYFGVCPFHEDHSPSMSVSEEKQIYKCFSCGAAGNVFTFVKDFDNVDFIEAVKIVADKVGIVFKGSKKKDSKPAKNSTEFEIMDLAIKFYQNNLASPKGAQAKIYLNERSLDDTVIKDFDIGLAIDIPLHKLLLKKNYKVETLLELGLINRNGEFINDIFQRRIIFPIHDLDGNPVGFTGRIYEDSNNPKYLNTKESPIFKKGQILFNYHRAKKDIKRLKEVIIVEGNMDAIRLFSVDIKNVVALMGTSLTNEQVSIIKGMRAKVILMLDNDDAGEIATLNNGNLLEKNGITPSIVRLSDEKDPDTYIIKKGVDAIKENINKPITFLDFKLKFFKKNKDVTKTEDLVSYLKEVIKSLGDIKDDLTKELTIKKMSEEYDIPRELLVNELKKVNKLEKKVEIKEEIKKEYSKYEKLARNVLYYMMNSDNYVRVFKKELGFFKIKEYRSITNEINYYNDLNGGIDLASFITYISDKDYIYDEVMDIIKNTRDDELKMEYFLEYIKIIKNEDLKEEIKELKVMISNELDENKRVELASKLIDLKKGCVINE